MASLQDQLLQAGLVDKKKAKDIKKEQRKKAKQQPKGSVQVDETRQQAKRTLADKSERDREANRKLQAESEKKAIKAQIVQLIKLNSVARGDGDIPYQFTDHKKIKKVYVTATLQTQLVKGQLAITKLGDLYELVPRAVAEKIQQRDASVILLLNNNEQEEADENDPYADYQIPDDLMW